MAHFNVDKVLTDLESGAEDELSLLISTGAKFFSTGHLLRLKGQWEIKNRLFYKFNNGLIRMVAISPLWLVCWFVLNALKLPLLSLFFMALFPISFFLFFAGLLFMKRFFKGKGHLDMVGEMIDTELNRRYRDKRKI